MFILSKGAILPWPSRYIDNTASRRRNFSFLSNDLVLNVNHIRYLLDESILSLGPREYALPLLFIGYLCFNDLGLWNSDVRKYGRLNNIRLRWLLA